MNRINKLYCQLLEYRWRRDSFAVSIQVVQRNPVSERKNSDFFRLQARNRVSRPVYPTIPESLPFANGILDGVDSKLSLMNFRSLALAAILGLSAPVVADVAIPQAAIAQSAPTGSFIDNNGEWEITLWFENGTYQYYGENYYSGDTLSLSGARQTRNSNPGRREYIWDNGAYEYLVAWQPSDPDFVRLQVFDPNGREILNRLMERVYY